MTIIDDTTADEYWQPAINVYERYNGPYSPEVHQFVEIMMNKRVIVRVDPVRIRTWDHRKLGTARCRWRHDRSVPLAAVQRSAIARTPGASQRSR